MLPVSLHNVGHPFVVSWKAVINLDLFSFSRLGLGGDGLLLIVVVNTER